MGSGPHFKFGSSLGPGGWRALPGVPLRVSGVTKGAPARDDEMVVKRPPAALVGRDLSLGVLRSALRRASDGSPSVVLVSGETGVGKTRLLRELVATQHFSVLYGACVPMAGDPLPFAPLTQALRGLSRSGTLNLQLERSPELARLVPGLGSSVRQDTSELGLSSQLGLFHAVLGLLERLGAAAPVVLVVEDVHWADRSTLDLVRFLANDLSRERAVLVVTYRADAVVVGTTLASWLAELGRLEITERLPLERLGPDDTARLVAGLLGSDPDPALLQSAMTRSAGNPLFAEHLVLQGAVGPLPETLSELLVSRVVALPDGTRRLLRAAAVIGRPATVRLIALTVGSSVEETESDLRPAITQHVMEVHRDDTIGFRHPAFAEVVYAELLPEQRRSLHRAAALALESTVPTTGASASGGHDIVAAELARHWAEAGDVPRALDAAVTAGRVAEQMFAFADAHASFARAVDLLPRVPGASHDRVRLLKHAAQAASLVGDSDEAVRLVEMALPLATESTARASLWTRLGSIHYLAGRGPQAERSFQKALALVPEDEESVLVARIHAGLGLLAAAWSRLDDADLACARGLSVARRVGARREEGLVRSAMGVVASARGDVDGAVDHLREALAIGREVGNPNDLATAYINLSHVLGLAGRLDEVIDLSREGMEILTRVGLSRQSGSFLQANLSHALIDSGRLAEAREVIDQALSHHPRGIRAAPVLIQAGRVALVPGNLPLARERLGQARAIIESENAPDAWLRELTEVAAEIELWASRPDAAYDLVVEGLRAVAGTDEESFGAMLVALGFRALADQAETRRDQASRERLETLRRPLEDARAQVEMTHTDDAAMAAWQRAEASRLDLANDPGRWADVAGRWQALGRPVPAAYALWREAEARLDIGVDATGTAVLRAVHHAALELGFAPLVDEVERLAGWHRVDLLPAPSPSTPGALDVYALTPREIEVLRSLAAGRSNQEIADHLFISVKTASVHVSNILRKLSVSGRHEAARVAHRLGITG
jgi:DNA-binding CsgD family transcriptional regulator/tetratricopeptide (TPR) repeat protein